MSSVPIANQSNEVVGGKKEFRNKKNTTIRSYRNKMKPTYELLKELEKSKEKAEINATRINVANRFEETVKPEFKKPEYKTRTDVKNTIDNNIPGLNLDDLTNKIFDIVPIDPTKELNATAMMQQALNRTTTGGGFTFGGATDPSDTTAVALTDALTTHLNLGQITKENVEEDGNLSDEEKTEEVKDKDSWKEKHPIEYSNVSFEKIVYLLEKKINEIITHPILTKIKCLKAEDVLELSKRTVIYETEDKSSFFPTKELIDSIMDFLFVDYTALDVYKQIYYFYKKKIDEEETQENENVAMNVIKQQIYTHSGIMKVIDTLLNKFTYITYYPSFINDREEYEEKMVSLLEKDTDYHRQVTNRDNKIEVDVRNKDKVQKIEGGMQQGGDDGESFVPTAISVSLQLLNGDENNELKDIMPKHRQYIYIKRFINLLHEFEKLKLENNKSNRYIQKMLSVIILNHIRNLGSVNKVLSLMMNPINQDFFEILNHLVRIQNSKLITFVKVNNYLNKSRLGNQLMSYNCRDFRNRHEIVSNYNRRFEVYVNNPNISDNWRLTDFAVKSQKGGKKTMDELRTGLKTLVVKYNDDDFPYYNTVNPEYISDEILKISHKDLYDTLDYDLKNNLYVLEKDKDKFDVKEVKLIRGGGDLELVLIDGKQLFKLGKEYYEKNNGFWIQRALDSRGNLSTRNTKVIDKSLIKRLNDNLKKQQAELERQQAQQQAKLQAQQQADQKLQQEQQQADQERLKRQQQAYQEQAEQAEQAEQDYEQSKKKTQNKDEKATGEEAKGEAKGEANQQNKAREVIDRLNELVDNFDKYIVNGRMMVDKKTEIINNDYIAFFRDSNNSKYITNKNENIKGIVNELIEKIETILKSSSDITPVVRKGGAPSSLTTSLTSLVGLLRQLVPPLPVIDPKIAKYSLEKVNKYDSTYFFGRINQVFLPHLSNQEVAENMESIIQTITNPNSKKKLFTIGYGASGAGKTSSLIYLNKGAMENREGVVIHLCNRLGELGYDKASVTTKEFFAVPESSDENNLKEHLETQVEQKVKAEITDFVDGNDTYKQYIIVRGPFDFTYRENENNVKQFLFNLPGAIYGGKKIKTKGAGEGDSDGDTDDEDDDSSVATGTAQGTGLKPVVAAPATVPEAATEPEVAPAATEATETATETATEATEVAPVPTPTLTPAEEYLKSLAGKRPSEKLKLIRAELAVPTGTSSSTTPGTSTTSTTSTTSATPSATSGLEFTAEMVNKSKIFGNVHKYRTYDVEEVKKTSGGGMYGGADTDFRIRFANPQFNEELNWTDEKAPVNLGNLLIYLIDSDRFVKATTNNPNSSRSHVLLFLRMELSNDVKEEQNKEGFTGKKLADAVDVIIGDFAGVENKFDCADAIPDFMAIERDVDPRYLYYKPDAGTNQIVDLFGGGGREEEVKKENLKLVTNVREELKRLKSDETKVLIPNKDMNEKWKDSLLTLLINKKGDLKEILTLNNENDSDVNIVTLQNSLRWANNNYDKLEEEIQRYNALNGKAAFEELEKEFEEKKKTAYVDLKLSLANILVDPEIKYYRPQKYNNGVLPGTTGKELTNIKLIDWGTRISLVNELNKAIEIVEEWFQGTSDTSAAIDKLNYYLESAKLRRYYSFFHNAPSSTKQSLDEANQAQRNSLLVKLVDKYTDKYGIIHDVKSINDTAYKYLEKKINEAILKYYQDIITIASGLKYINPEYKFKETPPEKYTNLLDDNFKQKLSELQRMNGGFYSEDRITEEETSIGGAGEARIDYDNTKAFMQSILEQIKKLKVYYDSGMKICKNRTVEGIFINQTLSDVRKTIQEMLVYNSQGSIEMTPDFIENCMQVYCPGDKECFKMNQVAMNSEKIPSVLFKAIFDHYYVPSTKSSNTAAVSKRTPEQQEQDKKDEELRIALRKFFHSREEKNKKDFYEEMMVSLFCVFNVSIAANNPPIVPYIDINSLKRNFVNQLYKTNNYYKIKLIKDLKKALRQIARFPSNLKELNKNEGIKILAKVYLGLNLPVDESSTNFGLDFPTPFSNSKKSNLLNEDYKRIDQAGRDVFSSSSTAVVPVSGAPAPAVSIYDSTEGGTVPPKDKVNELLFEKYMNELITNANNVNAASVIGTLEFIDQMSKFATVDNLCTINDIQLDDDFDESTLEYHDESDEKPTFGTYYQEIVDKNNEKFNQMKQKLQLYEISNKDVDYTKSQNPKNDFFQLLSDHYKYEMEHNSWKFPSTKKVEEVLKGGKRHSKTVRAVELIRRHSTERKMEEEEEPSITKSKRTLKNRDSKSQKTTQRNK